MNNKMDDHQNMSEQVAQRAEVNQGEPTEAGKKPKPAIKQARKRPQKVNSDHTLLAPEEEIKKRPRKSAPSKPRAPRAKKSEEVDASKAVDQAALSSQASQADFSVPDGVHIKQDNNEGNEHPQSERRGRGLRAVVSRTRRKNVQKQATQRPKEGGALAGGAPRLREQHEMRGKSKGEDGDICFDDIVSGRFDDGTVSNAAKPQKRVLAPQLESPKLHKVLAQAGIGSRLDMEQLILEGRISVNAEPAHIGQRIQYGDQVRVNGKPIRVQIAPPPARVLAYHKPTGEIVTHDDPQDRPTVFRKLPKLTQGKWLSIGRLDINTEGLLLFTNSGDLANALMHPRFSVEREYAVRVLGGLSPEEKKSLLDGIELEDGRAHFKSIEDGGGEGANQWYRVVITEGRNREVRRMIESFGRAVSRLIRIRYGAVVLPSHLKQAAWVELSEDELQALGKLVGGRAEAAINAGQQNTNPRRGGGNTQRGRRDDNRAGARTANTRGGARDNRAPRKASSEQPDPMKTSVGYIKHDTFISPSADTGRNRGRSGGLASGGFKRRSNRTAKGY